MRMISTSQGPPQKMTMPPTGSLTRQRFWIAAMAGQRNPWICVFRLTR
jgi:hypothetical protein